MRITVQEVIKEYKTQSGDVLTKAVCAWLPMSPQEPNFVQSGLVALYSKESLGLKPYDELVGRMEFIANKFEDRYYNLITFDIENADNNSEQV